MKKFLIFLLFVLIFLSGCESHKAGTNGIPRSDIVYFNNQTYDFSHMRIVQQVGRKIGRLDKKVNGKSYAVYEIPNVDPKEKAAIKTDEDPTYYEIDKTK